MPEAKLTFTEETIDQVKIFRLEGKVLGGKDTLELCNRIETTTKENIKRYILDFENTKWLNSNGIGSIIACIKIIRKSGGELRFTNVKNVVEIYFRFTRLETIVEIFDNIPNALKSFESNT